MESQSLEQILLTMELITREQLTDALEYQCRLPKSEHMSLADILVEMEYVSAEAIESIESYLFAPPPVDNAAERIRRSVEDVTPSSKDASVRVSLAEQFDPSSVSPVATSPEPTVVDDPTPVADEEWQRMYAMEEWQQMQSLCVEESREDKQNLEKIMGDLGISDPRALQVGFTIKRKP